VKRIVAFLFLALCAASRADDDCYFPIIQADIPCIYFRMDAASGTIQNGSGFHGASDGMTIFNAPTLNATGIPGANPNKATTFNGTTQYEADFGGNINNCLATVAGPAVPCFGSPALTHDYTSEGWFNQPVVGGAFWGHTGDGGPAPATGTYMDVAGIDGGGHFSCVLFQNNAGGNFAQVSGTTTILTNTWYYGACAVTGSSFAMGAYLNGVLENTGSSSTGTCGGNAIWGVGADQFFTGGGFPTAFMNGTLDEIATYNRHLTSGQIASHYFAGILRDSCINWPFTVKQERHMLQAPDGITSEALRAEAYVRRVTTPGICGLPVLRHKGLG
jgi:hypothetical protein